MKTLVHPSTSDLAYKRKQKAKYMGWYKYFEGDGIAFGEVGRYYRWIVPFVIKGHTCSNYKFVEVSIEEYVEKKDLRFSWLIRIIWDIWKNI